MFISCKESREKISEFDNNSTIEMYRKLVLEEWENSDVYMEGFEDSFDIHYAIPDTVDEQDPRIKYIRRNKLLPDYIVKALIEKRWIITMTIGEYFLAFPEEEGTSKIAISKYIPGWIEVGSPSNYDKQSGMIRGGMVVMFRYGFLWNIGTI